MEIQGFSPPWRPFSDLVWLTDDILVFDRWSNPHYGIHYVVDVGARQVISAAAFPDQMPLPEEPLTSDGADLQTNTELHCSTIVETQWGDSEFEWGRCSEDGSPVVPFYPAIGPEGQIFVLDPAHQRLLIYTEHTDPAIIPIDSAYAFEGVCKYDSPQWRNVSVSGDRWFLNCANWDVGRVVHQVAAFSLDTEQEDAHFSLEPYYPAQPLLTKALISDKQGGTYVWLDSGGLVHLDADLRPSLRQLSFDYTDNLTVGWDNHVYTYQADKDCLRDWGNPGWIRESIDVYYDVLAGSAIELPALVRLIGADAAGRVYFSVAKMGQHYYVRIQPGGASQVAPIPDSRLFRGVDVAADGSMYSLVYDLEDLSVNPKIVKCTFYATE